MKVAAAQISCALGDITGNLAKVESFAARARESGATLIVFPEMADTGYSMEVIRQHATSWNEGPVPRLQKIAKALELTIVCGVSERANDKIYNSQVVIDGTGEIIAKYRKTHLFGAPPNVEHLCFASGDTLADFSLAPFRIGLSICYDLRFPELYRRLALEHKATAFVISAAWPFPRLEHFRTLVLARAIENQSYVIAANRVGTDDGVTCCGTSAIIDPSGIVLAGASLDREELIMAELSEDVLKLVRDRMNVFSDRRVDIYG